MIWVQTLDLEVQTGFWHPFYQMHVVPPGTVLAPNHSSCVRALFVDLPYSPYRPSPPMPCLLGYGSVGFDRDVACQAVSC